MEVVRPAVEFLGQAPQHFFPVAAGFRYHTLLDEIENSFHLGFDFPGRLLEGSVRFGTHVASIQGPALSYLEELPEFLRIGRVPWKYGGEIPVS